MDQGRTWPPTPDDLTGVPLWENFVAGQVVQASLGIIPPHTLGFGVAVDGLRVELCFQLSEVTAADLGDMDDIEDELHMVTGHVLEVTRQIEVREHRSIAPSGSPIWWLYLARSP